jgi:hypothetical protein
VIAMRSNADIGGAKEQRRIGSLLRVLPTRLPRQKSLRFLPGL